MITLAQSVANACQPWSLVPLLCLGLALPTFIGLPFLTKYLIKKEKEWILNIILFVLGIILLGLELYHQITRYIQFGHYDFTSVPWQVCSVPLYFCLIVPWIKKGVVKDSFIYFLGLYYIFAGSFPLLFGQAQLCRWETVFGVVRSFIWHIIIVWIAIICLSMRPIGQNLKANWKPLVGAVGIFLCCNLIAQSINVTLHYAGGVNYPAPVETGYKDEIYAAHHQFDPDTCSCFYISPWMKSAMPVYRDVWVKVGWGFNWAFYYVTFSAGAILVYFAFFGYHQLVKFIKSKRQAKKTNE